MSCLAHVYSRRQLSDIAEGLYFLHSRNVVHGDLKGVRDRFEPHFAVILTHSVKYSFGCRQPCAYHGFWSH